MLHGAEWRGKVNSNMERAYPEPAIYDVLNSPGTGREVAALERVFRRYGPPPAAAPALWLEPACGTGRYLRVLRRRGYRVAGFDADDAMLEYARGRRDLDGAVLFRADMTRFTGPARRAGIPAGGVDAAINPVNSLRHLDSDEAVITHLDAVARILKPGGVYIVGLSLTDYACLEPEEDLWTGVRGRLRVSQLVNYLPPEPGTDRDRRETVISHLTVTRPGGERHLDHRFDLRTYDAHQWSGLVARSALRVAASCDAAGRPLDGRSLPYQLEALVRS